MVWPYPRLTLMLFTAKFSAATQMLHFRIFAVHLAKQNTVYWEIFEVKYFRCFRGFACYLEILTMQKTLIPLLSMINKWPSSKIYSRKGPILENFVPRKFPNIRYVHFHLIVILILTYLYVITIFATKV